MVKRPLRGGKADPLPTGAIDAERRVKVRGVHGLSASVSPRKQVVFEAYVRFARFLCLRLKHRSLLRDRHLVGVPNVTAELQGRHVSEAFLEVVDLIGADIRVDPNQVDVGVLP